MFSVLEKTVSAQIRSISNICGVTQLKSQNIGLFYQILTKLTVIFKFLRHPQKLVQNNNWCSMVNLHFFVNFEKIFTKKISKQNCILHLLVFSKWGFAIIGFAFIGFLVYIISIKLYFTERTLDFASQKLDRIDEIEFSKFSNFL